MYNERRRLQLFLSECANVEFYNYVHYRLTKCDICNYCQVGIQITEIFRLDNEVCCKLIITVICLILVNAKIISME